MTKFSNHQIVGCRF